MQKKPQLRYPRATVCYAHWIEGNKPYRSWENRNISIASWYTLSISKAKIVIWKELFDKNNLWKYLNTFFVVYMNVMWCEHNKGLTCIHAIRHVS